MSVRLYVGGLPSQFTEADLVDVVAQATGIPPLEVTIIRDRDTQRSRGFGFVTVETATAGDTVRSVLDGFNILGRKLLVAPAHER